MCSRNDTEHLAPEPELCTECGIFEAVTQGLCDQCLERARHQWGAERRAQQLDERAAAILDGKARPMR